MADGFQALQALSSLLVGGMLFWRLGGIEKGVTSLADRVHTLEAKVDNHVALQEKVKNLEADIAEEKAIRLQQAQRIHELANRLQTIELKLAYAPNLRVAPSNGD